MTVRQRHGWGSVIICFVLALAIMAIAIACTAGVPRVSGSEPMSASAPQLDSQLRALHEQTSSLRRDVENMRANRERKHFQERFSDFLKETP